MPVDQIRVMFYPAGDIYAVKPVCMRKKSRTALLKEPEGSGKMDKNDRIHYPEC